MVLERTIPAASGEANHIRTASGLGSNSARITGGGPAASKSERMKPFDYVKDRPTDRGRHLPKSIRPAATAHRVQRAASLAGCLLALGFSGAAQGPSDVQGPPPKTIAAECAAKEELVIRHPGSYLRYRLHEVNQKGDTVREQIETPQGTVARLIERDGRSLSAEQDAAERSRLQAMIDSPDDFARHVRHEDEGRKEGLDLLREMPDAMLWTYAPGQPQLPTRRSGEPPLIVLDFKPNPQWSAPDLQSNLLTGLEGRVWIDARAHRLVRLQADIFRPVNVGWGFLAHVYPGGTVTLDQTNAGGERWIVSHMGEQFTVRALVFKSVRQQTTSDTSDYQAVPAMPYQQAIKLLLDTPLPQR